MRRIARLFDSWELATANLGHEDSCMGRKVESVSINGGHLKGQAISRYTARNLLAQYRHVVVRPER